MSKTPHGAGSVSVVIGTFLTDLILWNIAVSQIVWPRKIFSEV